MNVPVLHDAAATRSGPRQQMELARERFQEAIRSSTGRAREPRWLARLRDEAALAFAAQGLPTPKHEDWKHTSLAALARVPWNPGSALISAADAPLAEAAAALPSGAELTSLAEAAASSTVAAEHLGRIARTEGRPFAALNAALWRDGVFVHAPSGTDLPALHLRVAAGGAEDCPAAHPRLLVVAGARSRIRLLVEHTTAGPADALANTVIELHAGEGADVELVQLVRPATGTFAVGALHARLERDAHLRTHAAVLGSVLARSDVEVSFCGGGAAAEVDGVLLAGAGQTADAHTFLEHAASHTTAEERYHAVVAGRGHGVFHGRITIREDAQQTDARQTSKSLLLDEAARMDARPQLEIHADDVRCVHGGAVGQLDPEALFYLRARGIAPREARALLVEAFVRQVTARLDAAHRNTVEAALATRLRLLVAEPGELVS